MIRCGFSVNAQYNGVDSTFNKHIKSVTFCFICAIGVAMRRGVLWFTYIRGSI